MTSPFNPNPLNVAREVQQMAQRTKGTDCEIFQKVALVSMCIMAAAGTSQVLLQLWNQLNHKENKDRRQGRGR
jgi:hypothetical protein